MLRDIRCPACKRLLCRIDGRGTVIEVKCRGGLCAATVVVDDVGHARVKTERPIARAS